ncbi:MAG: hypothetical protein WBC55_09805 [Dehalococcoidia bacterium]
MKKPSQSQFLLLVIVAALIGVGIYFVVVTVKQARAASDLETQIVDMEAQISSINRQYDIDALNDTLNDLYDELEEAEFPEEDGVGTIAVLDVVEEAKDAAGVRIIYGNMPDTVRTVYLNGNENDNGTEYTAFIYELEATATELSGLYDFLYEIESNASYESLIINAVEIEYIHATVEEPAYWDMTFEIVVYAQL